MARAAKSNGRVDPAQGVEAGARRRAWVWALLVVAALGIVARLLLSWLSEGTTDATSFRQFAEMIDANGLLWTYESEPLFNHPPLMGYWTWLAWKLGAGPEQPDLFAPVFRLPMIAADAGSAWVLWRMGLRRSSPLAGAALAAAMCWNPVAILIGAFHCNTDNLYAFLCLLCVYLLDSGGAAASEVSESHQPRPFWAGLALGAAINVKLIPVLLIAPLVLSCRGGRAMAKFMGAMAIMVLPFMPVMLLAGEAFYRNAIAYRSQLDRWGLTFLLTELETEQMMQLWASPLKSAYLSWGPTVILAAIVCMSAFNHRRRRWGPAEACALAFALFLVLTPAFGVQYLAMIVPLLVAVDRRFAWIYGTIGGLFLVLAYLSFWTGKFPLYSDFEGPIRIGPSFVGVVLWVVLAHWTLRRGGGRAASASEAIVPPAPGLTEGSTRSW